MGIDRIPAVGRILVRNSILVGGFFRAGGRITRLTRDRVYYESMHEEEKHHDTYVGVHNVAAVCDTHDEVEKLLAFDQEMRDKQKLLARAQREDCKRRFGL